jgi:hypothetical protein
MDNLAFGFIYLFLIWKVSGELHLDFDRLSVAAAYKSG